MGNHSLQTVPWAALLLLMVAKPFRPQNSSPGSMAEFAVFWEIKKSGLLSNKNRLLLKDLRRHGH